MTSGVALLRNNRRTIAAVTAMVVDALIVLLGYEVARAVTAAPPDHLLFIITSATFLSGLTAAGVYRMMSALSLRRQFMTAGRAYFQGVGIVLLLLVLVRPDTFTGNLPIVFLISIPLAYVIVWRTVRGVLARILPVRLRRWKTLVLGFDGGMDRVLRRVHSSPELGYDVVRVMKADVGADGCLRFDPADMHRAVAEQQVEMILLSSSRVDGSFNQLEELCRAHGVRMSILSRESDDLFLRTRINDLAGLPLFWPERPRMEWMKGTVKRAFDLIAGALLLVVLSPLFLVIAIAAWLESPGPVIFRQKRALSGHASSFTFYKFRSMAHGAELRQPSLAGMNESDGPLFKIRNDPRRTRVGRFLRRHSLDEMPQLINVLKGEMSLVGPRPLPVEDFALVNACEHLEGFIRHRARAKPGMTGLWQISGRSDLGFREMVLLDLYYVQHQSILFDIEILVQTLPVVFFGRGAY